MIIAETERLWLREATEDDAAFLLELVNTPSWLQFIGDRNVYSIDDARAYLLNGAIASYRKNGFGSYCLVVKDRGQTIGMCGLYQREIFDVPDLGFALLPPYEGLGYAGEASAAIIRQAREQLGLPYILGITSKENERSMSLLQRLGFVLEGDARLPGDDETLNLFRLVLHDESHHYSSAETLSAKDAETVRTIWNNEYPESLRLETTDDFQRYLGNLEDKTHYLVRIDGKLCGWALAFRRDDARWFAMILDGSIHGKGIGTRLLERLKTDNPLLYGWAIDHNNALKKDGTAYRSPLDFYRKNGFNVEPEVRLEIPSMSAVKIVFGN